MDEEVVNSGDSNDGKGERDGLGAAGDVKGNTVQCSAFRCCLGLIEDERVGIVDGILNSQC
jgi:hypothetical protein